jgi:DNA polymerase-3 subunit delta
MAELKPAYLVHGEDHGAISERRARLRALAEADGDANSVELLDGEAATPAGLAHALCAMTLALGRRVIVVDGVERWKQVEVEQQLTAAMRALPPDTTVALFAREEGRGKAPAAIHKAVKDAGGQVVEHATVKPWKLPDWVREQARGLGLELDAAAAKALVSHVGERQQRLLRELEKLALQGSTTSRERGSGPEPGPGSVVRVTVEDVERAARSGEQRAFALADALVGGAAREATRTYVRLRQQGERLPGLTYLMAGRVREALAVSLRLGDGESKADVRRGLRMPPKAAERFVADVARADPERLRAALGVLADLELNSRGGAQVSAWRDGSAMLEEDTQALRAIERITG